MSRAMSRLALAVALTGLLVIAAPNLARADEVKHRGALTGVPGSAVRFTLEQRGGEPRRIENMAFRRVPYTCAGGSSGTISAKLPSFPLRGSDFTRRGRIQGSGVRKGSLRVAGRFTAGGERARGRVRFSFERRRGGRCGTRRVHWTTKEK